MQPSTLWNALRHFWFVVLIGLLAAAGAGMGMWFFTGATHTAAASVTLIPPTSTPSVGQDTPTRGNPLFYLSGLNQARDLVVSQLDSATVANNYEARYPNNEYSAAPDMMSSGPIVILTVTGRDPEPVLRQLSDLTASVPVVLADLQDQLDVAEFARVRSLEVTRDTESTVERKDQIRNAIAGFALVVATAGMATAVLERRRRMHEGVGGLVAKDQDRDRIGQLNGHDRG